MSQQRLADLKNNVVTVGPQTIHLDITNSCNTDCVTCWDHSPLLTEARPTSWKRRRVTVEHIRSLLDDVQTLGGLEAVIVSGMGEPFTHPDVYAILDDIKRRKLHVTVITNLVAADTARILELGIDQLLIGIHGATEKSYLAFHPSFSRMHWERLHAMLQRFSDENRRFKHVQVIAECNAHELVEMIDLAERYDAEQVNYKLASLGRGTEGAQITEQQRTWLLREGIPAARRRADALDVVTNLDVFELQLRTGGECTAPIEEVGCFLGHFYSRVTVDGTVLYCCNTDVEVGQLSDEVRFSDLWNGEAWNALRARMREGRYFDSCRQCGKVNQNVKLSARFRALYGDAAWDDVTGARNGFESLQPRLRVLP